MHSILLCLTGLSHIVGSKPMWHDSTRHEEPDDFLVREKKLEREDYMNQKKTNKTPLQMPLVFIIKSILPQLSEKLC